MHNRHLHILLALLLFSAGVRAQEEQDILLDTVPVTMQPPTGADDVDAIAFDSIGVQQPAVVRTIPQRVVDSLKAADEFWYASLERKKKQALSADEQPRKKTLFQRQWFRTLLWLIILGSFIGVVIWYLAASNIFIFRKKAKTIAGEETEEEVADDIFSLSYEKEISTAQAAGNYRLAVRLWYLRTLKELADRGLIDYRFGRTNQDYVLQLSKSSYYRDFFRLTRNFEYTWYGQFSLSADAYEMMRNDFASFKNSLR